MLDPARLISPAVPLESIHHIAYIVRDLDEALPLFEARFGLSVVVREELPDQQVEALALGIGHGQVELIAPTTPDSGAARFLDARGEGLHHVAYAVTELQSELDRLAAEGLELIDTVPRRGLGGHMVAFIHPKTAGGALTELVQSTVDH